MDEKQPQPPENLCFDIKDAISTPIYLRDGTAYADEDAVIRWAIAFPGFDVTSELRRISAWSYSLTQNRARSTKLWSSGDFLERVTMWLCEESRKIARRMPIDASAPGHGNNGRGAAGMPIGGGYQRTIEAIDKMERQYNRRQEDIRREVETLRYKCQVAHDQGQDERPFKQRIRQMEAEIERLDAEKEKLHQQAVAAWRKHSNEQTKGGK